MNNTPFVYKKYSIGKWGMMTTNTVGKYPMIQKMEYSSFVIEFTM